MPTEPLSEYATAVHDVLLATARPSRDGRLVSTEPLYRFLLDRFGIEDPQSRRVRTAAVRELTARGLVRRVGTRGRAVEVLGGADNSDDAAQANRSPAREGDAVSYEEFATAVDRDLDAPADGHRRVEQAFLRRVLLGGAGRGGAGRGTCAFCGCGLPADLLVAAHVKPRADLSRAERLRFREVAVLACTLGCDALYEHGYIAVDGDGRLLAARPSGYDALDVHLAGLADRQSEAHGGRRDPYLAEHRTRRFRGL